jgi:RNA polymerase sigma-70 factor (ECF subfamily)
LIFEKYRAYHASVLEPADFAVFFEKYGPVVYRRAIYLLGNPADAEEAAQEVFVRALRSAEAFEQRSQVSTWLIRITTNHCLNMIRDRKRRRELFDTKVKPAGHICPAAVSPEGMILMRRLLSEADQEQARAATYVLVDGMSHSEAAEMLGVSRRTVGNLIARFVDWAREQSGEE